MDPEGFLGYVDTIIAVNKGDALVTVSTIAIVFDDSSGREQLSEPSEPFSEVIPPGQSVSVPEVVWMSTNDPEPASCSVVSWS